MSGRWNLNENELRVLVTLDDIRRAGSFSGPASAREIADQQELLRARRRHPFGFDGLSEGAVRWILEQKLVPLGAAARVELSEHRFAFGITDDGCDDLAGRDLVGLGLRTAD